MDKQAGPLYRIVDDVTVLSGQQPAIIWRMRDRAALLGTARGKGELRRQLVSGRKHWAAIGLVVLSLALASCAEKTAQSGVHNIPTSPTPTDKPVSAPPGSLVAGSPITSVDPQGFRYAIREQTGPFTATYVDDQGVTHTASSGDDILVLHFTVTNLLSDRSGTFNSFTINIYGSCDTPLAAQTEGAPPLPGQCTQNPGGWLGWYGSRTQQTDVTIPDGQSVTFDIAAEYPASTDVTAMTIWVDTCEGYNGPPACSFGESYDLLGGGVHLSPPAGS